MVKYLVIFNYPYNEDTTVREAIMSEYDLMCYLLRPDEYHIECVINLDMMDNLYRIHMMETDNNYMENM